MAGKVKLHTRYKNEAGKVVPGVTTVINNLGWNKGALMGWARKVAMMGEDPDKIRDEAADIGTIAHMLVEVHLLEIVKKISNEEAREIAEFDPDQWAPADMDKAENGFLAYLEWEDQHKVEPLSTETRLVSEKYQYGGTLDLVARVDDELSLIDFKTSKGIWPEHKIQVAAYVHLYKENYGWELKPHILQLNKETGEFHYLPPSELSMGKSWKLFKMLREIHDMKKIFK